MAVTFLGSCWEFYSGECLCSNSPSISSPLLSVLCLSLISPGFQEMFKGQAFAVCGRQEIRQSRCLKCSFIPGCPVECGLLECWAVSVCFSQGCFPRSASLLLELLRTGEIMNSLVLSWAAQASSCLSFLRRCSLCWHNDLQSVGAPNQCNNEQSRRVRGEQGGLGTFSLQF